MARKKLAKREQQPSFKAPKYDVYSGDPFIWEMNKSQLYHAIRSQDIDKAFAVAETLGVPYCVFWNWWDAVAFVAGKQIIERKGKPVWYVSSEAAERGGDESDTGLPGVGTYAQWMPYFHAQYIPQAFHWFLPAIPDPTQRPQRRHREDRGYRENPSRRAARAGGHRAGGKCKWIRRNPVYKDAPTVPDGVYYAYEIKPCCCMGSDCNQVGPRIGVDFNGTPLALFGMGAGMEEIEFDRDVLWEEACLFIAAHQLFQRNVRPVWVQRLQWPEIPPAPDPNSPLWDEYTERWDSGEYSFPIGEYAPYEYNTFHVTYYPYAISAAVELPSPPLPPGQLMPPAEPTIVPERAMREAQQQAAMLAAGQAGGFGPWMGQLEPGAVPALPRGRRKKRR